MTRSSSEQISTLLAWCALHEVWIDPRLEIRVTDNGLGVFANAHIPEMTTVVKIPKDIVLSSKCSSLSDCIPPASYGLEGQLALAFALYVETLKGSSSKWYGYLQSLPSSDSTVDIPLFWDLHVETGDDGGGDCEEALMWLRGTQAEWEMKRSDSGTDSTLESLMKYYYTVVEPTISREMHEIRGSGPTGVSLGGYQRSFGLVSSRAFLVDAFNGLSMVPIADAFNHSQDNHVHLESDYDVCPQCGSLDECVHDRGGDSQRELDQPFKRTSIPDPAHLNPPAWIAQADLDAAYEMVSNTPILPHTEIFNTYGESLNNAQLLVRYGFILDVNDNDCVYWREEDLHGSTTPHQLRRHHQGDVRDDYPSCERVNDLFDGVNGRSSEIFRRIASSRLVSQLACGTPGEPLFINSDGKISKELWLRLALRVLVDNGSGGGGVVGISNKLKLIFELQIMLEEEGDPDVLHDRGGLKLETSPYLKMVLELAKRISTLCSSQKHQIGKPGVSEEDIGNVLDGLPTGMVRTRMALMIVMCERSILDSCAQNWEELVDGLQS